MSNCADDHSRFHLVHIVENPILPDAQLPNKIHMVPGRHQTHEDFPIPGLPGRLISQLYFNTIEDLRALARMKVAKIISDTL